MSYVLHLLYSFSASFCFCAAVLALAPDASDERIFVAMFGLVAGTFIVKHSNL